MDHFSGFVPTVGRTRATHGIRDTSVSNPGAWSGVPRESCKSEWYTTSNKTVKLPNNRIYVILRSLCLIAFGSSCPGDPATRLRAGHDGSPRNVRRHRLFRFDIYAERRALRLELKPS